MFEQHKKRLLEIIHQEENPLKGIVVYLHQNFSEKFHWVGFYFADHETQTLHLGPYVGEPTEHTQIPFGRGICGIVAKTQKTYVSQDVHQEPEYLACSIKVQAEVVIPIFHNDIFVAELDIDSHLPNAFSQEEITFLEDICQILGKNWNQVRNFKTG